MSEKTRQKKDHQRKDKDRQRMRESSSPRKQQASIRYGAENESDDRRRPGSPRTGK